MGLNVPETVTTPEQLTLDLAALAGAKGAGAGAGAGTRSAGPSGPASKGTKSKFPSMQNQEDAPPATTCGSIMVRYGAS